MSANTWNIIGAISGLICAIPIVWFGLHWLVRALGPKEKQIDSTVAQQINLEKYLAKTGHRIFWDDPKNVTFHTQGKTYERIVWKDADGKKWLLTNRPGGDMPLKAKIDQ
ncbi:MAG TPA: hypothetical protein PLE77_03560 [Kiritimatiellia bacterium]|nr:hypothetical protein [Kiritimatiellia bacterium]